MKQNSRDMAMTACYPTYGLLGLQRQRHQLQTLQHPAQQILSIPVPQTSRIQTPQMTPKDFSIPLHVDCSVEYELPNQAKPPPGARVEPLLLMIHPCYFRKIESEQRRSPFINNMPNSSRTSSSSSSSASSSAPSSSSSSISSTAISSSTSTASTSRRVRNMVVAQVPSATIHPNQSASESHSKDKTDQPQIIQRTIHSSQHISSIERHKLTAATAEMRSLAQQTQQQQQKMSLSQQAYYPANTSSNINHSNNTIFNSNLTNNSTLAGVQLCLDNWENSQMAAIPRDFQAGPDATPILNNSNSYRDDKVNALNGKYRQYLRTHRYNPYLITSATSYPQLASSALH